MYFTAKIKSKSRPLETLQQVMSAFKSFEKKLDKLQDDVNYHGQTLTDLRIMVGNLTTPVDHRIEQYDKNEVPKRPSRKNTAIQYEFDEPIKVKRKTAMQPLPSKIKAKSYQGPKYGLRMSGNDAPFITKMPSSPKALKHSPRLSKAEAPRKATTLRSQNNKVEKRRSKLKK